MRACQYRSYLRINRKIPNDAYYYALLSQILISCSATSQEVCEAIGWF